MLPGTWVDGGPEEGLRRCEKRSCDQAERLSGGSAISESRIGRATSCGTEGQTGERNEHSAKGLS